MTDKTQEEQGVTPLKEYKSALLKAGVSAKLVKDIIKGLSESPLYTKKLTPSIQEELIRSITDYVFQHDFSKAGSEYVDLRLFLEKVIPHYINKYYVPKGDLEDPSVSTEVGGNQADKLSELESIPIHLLDKSGFNGQRVAKYIRSRIAQLAKANSNVPKTFTLEEVEKIIGEDEGYEYLNNKVELKRNDKREARNELRAEQREKLNKGDTAS